MLSSGHVFISFKTEDRDAAFRLKTALNNSGYKVWWQETIQCGQEWHGEIDKAIKDAGAIVVLWSNRSIASPWVKHEASEAMAKDVYTPVRVEVMEIESPYNRVQATDMINWSGDLSHPGYHNLLWRLQELMPPPISFWRQSTRFIWKQKATIVLSFIAAISLFLLLRQSTVLNKQIQKQDETFKNVEKQRETLKSQGAALQSQIEKQDTLIRNGRIQSETLAEQLQQQRELSLNVQKQNAVLETQIQKQEGLARQSENIIATQTSLSLRMDSSSELIQNSLKIQEKSFGLLKTTSEDQKTLNLPISNGLGYIFKLRVYVDGISKVLKEQNSGLYLILSKDDTIRTYVEERINKFNYKKIETYQTFFSNISMGMAVSTILKYKLDGKENVIKFYENGVTAFRFWSAPKDIYFNPREEYFESEYFISSGGVQTNPDNITTLNSLFDSTEVILLFRFFGEKIHELPVNNTKNEVVKIKKVILTDFTELRYGNTGQFITKPGNRIHIYNNEEPDMFKKLPEKIDKKETWRYCIVAFPLTKN